MDVPLWTVTRYIYFMLLLAVTMQQFQFHPKWKINISLIVMLWRKEEKCVCRYSSSFHPYIHSSLSWADLNSQCRVININSEIKATKREAAECVWLCCCEKRMCSFHTELKWLPLWWNGQPRVRRCVKGGFEIVSEWLWLPSAGPGHYITESLLSSPWEGLTA